MFKKKGSESTAPNSLFQNESNFFYIILNFFNKFLKTLSWTSWQKKSGDWTEKREFQDWSLEKRKFEAAIWKMNFQAWSFGRLALISFRFGRGVQVGTTSLLEVNLYGASIDVGRIIFAFGTLQALGSHKNPRSLEEDEAFFYNAGSKDSETTHLQAAVRCCVTATLASETFWQYRQTCT